MFSKNTFFYTLLCPHTYFRFADCGILLHFSIDITGSFVDVYLSLSTWLVSYNLLEKQTNKKANQKHIEACIS